MSYVVINNNELCHGRSHKYIKREWRNGHWVYWYNLVSTNRSTTNQPIKAREAAKETRDINRERAKLAREMAPYSATIEDRNKKLELAKYQENVAESEERARKRLELAAISALKRGEEFTPDKTVKSSMWNERGSTATTTLRAISEAVGSTFDKGKKWLSGILTTKVTVTPAKPIQPKTGGIFSTKKTIKIL